MMGKRQIVSFATGLVLLCTVGMALAASDSKEWEAGGQAWNRVISPKVKLHDRIPRNLISTNQLDCTYKIGGLL